LEKKLLAYSPIRRKIGNATMFILHAPTFDLVDRLVNISVNKQHPDAAYISPQAFLGLSFLNAIASEFIATQTYPAWKDDDNRRTDEEISQILEMSLRISEAKRVAIEKPAASKRARTSTSENSEEDVEMVDQLDEEYRYVLKWDSLGESVLTAKPSPLPFTFNFGGPSEVPFMPGLAFPYFDRMMVPDNTTLRDTLSSRFLRCLGDSREEQRRVYGEIKKGLPELTRTQIGQEYLHVFIGIRLALDAQARLFLVRVSDEYAGFVLLGARFSILVDEQWHHAKSPEELKVDVEAMSSHTSSLNTVCELLSKLKIVSGVAKLDPQAVDPSSIANGHILWDEIAKRELTNEADMDALTDALRGISFTRSFLIINPANICWAINMITIDKHLPIPHDKPIYVPAAFRLLHERILKVLCCFGPDAFSFQNMSGSKFTITPAGRVDPNEAMGVDGKGKVLPSIIVSIKSVVTCFHDMNKTLNTKAITMNVKERAAKNRCHVFQGDSRDLIYGKLREAVKVIGGESSASTSLGKRKQMDDDKTNITTASALLGLF
jgi:hypothetical protein